MKLRTRSIFYFVLIGLAPFLAQTVVFFVLIINKCKFATNSLYYSLIALLSMMVVTLVVIAVLSKRFFRITIQRIELLNQMLKETASGHLLELKHDCFNDEISTLCESFIAMYQRMEQNHKELEENNRKLSYTNMSLEEKYAQSYTIKLIQEEIGRELDTDRLLRKTADIVMGVLGSKRCAIYMIDDIVNALVIKADTGFDSATENIQHIPLDADSIIAKSWRDKETYTAIYTGNQNNNSERVSRVLAIPLSGRENCLGAMVIEYESNKEISTDVIEFAQSIAQELSLSVENAFLYGKMRQMAIRDALTGTYNRMYLMSFLTEEFASKPKILTVIIMDLDHFKKVNDQYGHLAGDMVLKTTCSLIQSILPKGILARYGGEEFVIVLPETGEDEAFLIAEQIRQTVQDNEYKTADGMVIPVTLSLGLANYPIATDNYQKLLQFADQALYEAKESGRNRVCVARPAV